MGVRARAFVLECVRMWLCCVCACVRACVCAHHVMFVCMWCICVHVYMHVSAYVFACAHSVLVVHAGLCKHSLVSL